MANQASSISWATSGLVRRRPITSTFASFQRRAPAAVAASVHSAARTPRTLLAAIDAPVPVQQKSTAVSDRAGRDELADGAADLGPLLVVAGERPDELDLVAARHEIGDDRVGERGPLVGRRSAMPHGATLRQCRRATRRAVADLVERLEGVVHADAGARAPSCERALGEHDVGEQRGLAVARAVAHEHGRAARAGARP